MPRSKDLSAGTATKRFCKSGQQVRIPRSNPIGRVALVDVNERDERPCITNLINPNVRSSIDWDCSMTWFPFG